jgi:hypothetical protein
MLGNAGGVHDLAARGVTAARYFEAMSQENVEIVRTAFDTFRAEGIDAALSFFSPDLVWYPD